MANYERVTSLARQNGVVCWVTTTQPRNFGADSADVATAKRAGLMAGRDAIQAKYTDHILDFWNGFAEADGKIKASFDSGDGTHMNDSAHALLAERVIAAKVPEALISQP